MLLAIMFAQLWGVVQLLVLTSLSRTVRARTVLAAMAVGFYAIGPITAFIQLSWIRIAAHLLGKVVSDLTGVASYTVDPFIEEAMKLVPLLVLFLIPAIRRQWSVTDCLLIAASTGSGFGLAEHLFRYADYASTAQSVSGGYLMTIGSATPFVPGILTTLTSWIPLGVFFESTPVHINWHLAWCAITGLAVGLYLRNPKKWARPTAVGLIVLVCLNHAAGNAASVQFTWLSWIAAPMRFLDSVLWLLVLVAIGAAWWLDQPSQREAMAIGPLLAAEEAAHSPLTGTMTAAFSRLPWSLPWVLGFARRRRAYHAARAGAPGTVDDMHGAMIAERDGIDRKLSQPNAPPLLPHGWMPSNVGTTVASALRRPSVIIWLVLIAPSVLYLIIGGFPAASGLQAVMKGPIVWPIVLLITFCGQGRRIWRVLMGIRMLPAAMRHPIGDDAAMLTLQAATGLGTLSLAGFTFARVLSGVGAGERMLSTAHAADAINRTQPAGGAAVAGSGGAFDPPPPSPRLPGDAAPAEPAAGAQGGSGAAPGSSASNGAAPSDSPGGAGAGSAAVGGASPAAGVAASSIGGAFDPPPPSLDLPDARPAAAPSAAAPEPPVTDVSSSDTAAGDGAAQDVAADGAPQSPAAPTMAPATQAEIDAAAGKPPAATMTPASQADIDAAAGKPPAATMTPASQADIDAAAGKPPAATMTPASQADIDAAAGKPPAAPVEEGVGTRAPSEPPPISVHDLPNAAPDPSGSSPVPPPISVHDLPNAAPDPSGSSPVPPPISVKDLPDAPPADQIGSSAHQPPAATMAPASQADIDAASGKPPAATMAPASQADIDAATGKAPAATMAPASQSDIDAARGDQHTGPDGDGVGTRAPDDAPAPKPAAPSAQDQARQLAHSEQADDDAVAAQKEIARSEQADDDAVAAQGAADHPSTAPVHADSTSPPSSGGSAQPSAPHHAATDAADAAKAATDPLEAAAAAAHRDLVDAQQRENAAFFGKDAQGYRDARAALDAAKSRADAAQAAADAAKNNGSDVVPSHRKP